MTFQNKIGFRYNLFCRLLLGLLVSIGATTSFKADIIHDLVHKNACHVAITNAILLIYRTLFKKWLMRSQKQYDGLFLWNLILNKANNTARLNLSTYSKKYDEKTFSSQ
ncbi:MAG TPA: hypothetical protein DIC42_06910 [Holosporales bacterium]|nr:hypothetical protein [Holosporales bacterium]